MAGQTEDGELKVNVESIEGWYERHMDNQKDGSTSFPLCPKCRAELDSTTRHTLKCPKCETRLSELFGEEYGEVTDKIKSVEEGNRKKRVKARLEEALNSYPELMQAWKDRDYNVFTSLFEHEKYGTPKWRIAEMVMDVAGGDVVDAILKQLEKEGPCSYDFAEILVKVGDPKAVPLLKKLWDRGVFSSTSGNIKIKHFIDHYPELQGEVEAVKCDVCGRERPTLEMRYVVKPDRVGKFWFCEDTCWSKRGRLVGSAYSGAMACPFYSSGMCKVGNGSNVCSLQYGTYDNCHVHRLGTTKRF